MPSTVRLLSLVHDGNQVQRVVPWLSERTSERLLRQRRREGYDRAKRGLWTRAGRFGSMDDKKEGIGLVSPRLEESTSRTHIKME